MGKVQCVSLKSKNQMWEIIEKSLNNYNTPLDKKIHDEYYDLKAKLINKNKIKTETDNLKQNFISYKKQMDRFIKWYYMSHPNQISNLKSKTSEDFNIKKLKIEYMNADNIPSSSIPKLYLGSLKDEKINKNKTMRLNIITTSKEKINDMNKNTNSLNYNGAINDNQSRFSNTYNRPSFNYNNTKNLTPSNLKIIPKINKNDPVKILIKNSINSMEKKINEENYFSKELKNDENNLEKEINPKNDDNNSNNKEKISSTSLDKSTTSRNKDQIEHNKSSSQREDFNNSYLASERNLSSIEYENNSDINFFNQANIIELNLRKFFLTKKNIFLERVSKGPPSSYRWISWMISANLPENRNFEIFNFLKDSNIGEKIDIQIKKDLHRTLSDFRKFNFQDTKNTLYNILKAISNNDQEVGYCQGMNFIAGFLLIMSDFNELDTFYLMISLLSQTFSSNFGIRGFFIENFPMLNIYVRTFHILFEKKMPELKKHFDILEIPDEVWISKWIQTLFTLSLPVDFCMRIWDCILSLGLEFILNFTLSFMKYIEADLLVLDDLFDIIEFFKKLTPFYIVENEGNIKAISESIKLLKKLNIEEIILNAKKISIPKNIINQQIEVYEGLFPMKISNLNKKFNIFNEENSQHKIITDPIQDPIQNNVENNENFTSNKWKGNSEKGSVNKFTNSDNCDLKTHNSTENNKDKMKSKDSYVSISQNSSNLGNLNNNEFNIHKNSDKKNYDFFSKEINPKIITSIRMEETPSFRPLNLNGNILTSNFDLSDKIKTTENIKENSNCDFNNHTNLIKKKSKDNYSNIPNDVNNFEIDDSSYIEDSVYNECCSNKEQESVSNSENKLAIGKNIYSYTFNTKTIKKSDDNSDK